ncbi:MAG TPA: hypothetical protein ENK33_04265 [Desulfobacterales bacterium]|nr:hypothetical protein [Desulfobacterales bacterium]
MPQLSANIRGLPGGNIFQTRSACQFNDEEPYSGGISLRKILFYALLPFIITACAAGGASVSGGGSGLRAFWPQSGINRYQAVVYPASNNPPPHTLIVQTIKPQGDKK